MDSVTVRSNGCMIRYPYSQAGMRIESWQLIIIALAAICAWSKIVRYDIRTSDFAVGQSHLAEQCSRHGVEFSRSCTSILKQEAELYPPLHVDPVPDARQNLDSTQGAQTLAEIETLIWVHFEATFKHIIVHPVQSQLLKKIPALCHIHPQICDCRRLCYYERDIIVSPKQQSSVLPTEPDTEDSSTIHRLFKIAYSHNCTEATMWH